MLGKYIYCIIKTFERRTFGPLGIGAKGEELYTILFNDIAAVVSNSPIINYPVSRENSIAHEKAIEEVMQEYTVLPVRFATIAQDEEKVKKILEREHDRFVDLLKNMEGKKELGLKAIFIEDVIYKEILRQYKDIKALKERIVGLAPQNSYYQRMEIGKLVEQALGEEKEIYKSDILDTLSPLAEDVKINNTYGELMIINAAFLIEKHKEAEFDQKVGQFGEKYNNKIKFKYVGTLPPFNFVNLVIETGRY